MTRAPDRSVAARSGRDAAQPAQTRTYGAPIGEAPRETIPLNAPINSAPTTTMRRADNSFSGRTVEASDNSSPRTPAPAASNPPPRAPAPAATSAVTPSVGAGAAGSAAVGMPPTAPPSAVDVTLAKIVKRVTPVLPSGTSRKAKGYVLVQFNITEKGRVSDVQVLDSSPAGTFDDAATDAVRKWVYEPRKENGVAVPSPAKARLVFDASN